MSVFDREFGGTPSLAPHKFDLPVAALGEILLWCYSSCQASQFMSDPSLVPAGRQENQGTGQSRWVRAEVAQDNSQAKHRTDRDTVGQWQAVHSHLPRLWKAKQIQPKCCGTNLGPKAQAEWNRAQCKHSPKAVESKLRQINSRLWETEHG